MVFNEFMWRSVRRAVMLCALALSWTFAGRDACAQGGAEFPGGVAEGGVIADRIALPPSVRGVVVMRGAAEHRKTARGRAIVGVLQDLGVLAQTERAWAELSKSVAMDGGEAFDAILGRWAAMVVGEAEGDGDGATTPWTLVTETDLKVRGLITTHLKPAPRDVWAGRRVLWLENGAYELVFTDRFDRSAWDVPRSGRAPVMMVAPSRAAALFGRVLETSEDATHEPELAAILEHAAGGADLFAVLRSDAIAVGGSEERDPPPVRMLASATPGGWKATFVMPTGHPPEGNEGDDAVGGWMEPRVLPEQALAGPPREELAAEELLRVRMRLPTNSAILAAKAQRERNAAERGDAGAGDRGPQNPLVSFLLPTERVLGEILGPRAECTIVARPELAGGPAVNAMGQMLVQKTGEAGEGGSRTGLAAGAAVNADEPVALVPRNATRLECMLAFETSNVVQASTIVDGLMTLLSGVGAGHPVAEREPGGPGEKPLDADEGGMLNQRRRAGTVKVVELAAVQANEEGVKPRMAVYWASFVSDSDLPIARANDQEGVVARPVRGWVVLKIVARLGRADSAVDDVWNEGRRLAALPALADDVTPRTALTMRPAALRESLGRTLGVNLDLGPLRAMRWIERASIESWQVRRDLAMGRGEITVRDLEAPAAAGKAGR